MAKPLPVNTEMISALSAHFRQHNNPMYARQAMISLGLSVEGLVGFWPMTASNTNSVARDFSGNGLHLSANGAVLFRTEKWVPCAVYDGASRYHYHADATDFDLTGSLISVHPSYDGITMMAWVYFDTAASATENIAGKWQTSQLSYTLSRTAAGYLQFGLSADGSTAVNFTSTGDTILAQQWTHVVARWDPGTSVDLYVNGVKDAFTSGVPASCYNGTAEFMVGARCSSSVSCVEMDGRVSSLILSKMVVDESFVFTHYELTKAMYQVSL